MPPRWLWVHQLEGIAQRYNPRKAVALRERLAGSEDRPVMSHLPDFLDHRRLGRDALSCMAYFKVQKQVVEMFAQFRKISLSIEVFRGSVGPDAQVCEAVRS